MALFAPILASSQPAFVPQGSYPVTFSLSSFNSWDEITGVEIKINNQANDSSIVRVTKLSDDTYINAGYILRKTNFIKNGSSAIVNITNEDIVGWEQGNLYKIQMRFYYNTTYSEWSNVMIVKPIHAPTLSIATITNKTVLSLAPLFEALTSFDVSDKEMEEKFNFLLYNNDALVEESGWITHTEQIDKYRFKTILNTKATNKYKLIYKIVSVNGFENSLESSFEVRTLTLNEEIQLETENALIEDNENACAVLNITPIGDTVLTGTYVITRASEKTNFAVWEDVKYVQFNKFKHNTGDNINVYTFRDFTVENGVAYKYAIQRETSTGYRTNAVSIGKDTDTIAVDYEYGYLVGDDSLQLKLKFNTEISSFKHTKLENKADTLGSKYPTISRNGYADYAEFPLSGLITFHMDEDCLTFLKFAKDGLYYKNNLIIPKDKLIQNKRRTSKKGESKPDEPFVEEIGTQDLPSYVIDYNLTSESIQVEKAFREAVLDFLGNGNYKLFKSPTEGNILISLINVSLSPENTLGRMIYKFSATAYEVGDTSLETLNKFNVIDCGSYKEVTNFENQLGFNQLNGFFAKGTKLIDLIGNKVASTKDETFVKLKSLWVEAYPLLDKKGIDSYKLRIDSTANEKAQNIDGYLSIIINGQTFYFKAGSVLYIEDNLDDNIVIPADSWLLINYTYEYTTKVNSKGEPLEAKRNRCFGQLEGLFTEKSIIEGLKPKLTRSRSLNIWKEIQEDVLKNYYGDKILESELNDNKDLVWYYYETISPTIRRKHSLNFNSKDGVLLYFIDIEASTGTSIKLITEDSEQNIVIGNSEKYSLRSKKERFLEHFFKSLAFTKDTYSIINYDLEVIETVTEEVDYGH